MIITAFVVAAVWTSEVWGSPPQWLGPPHDVTVRVLHWAKQYWLSAAALAALAALVAAVAPFILRLADERSARRNRDEVRARQRATMITRVRYKWVTGVLEASLKDAALLVLGLSQRKDVLDLSGLARRGRPGQRRPLPEGVPISEIFGQIGGGMLIIGKPGSGKTTLLLQLADQLLTRADNDPTYPVPVVFNLASWSQDRKTLGEWMTDELVTGYNVPAVIARQWVEEDSLTPLLDGLDEVAAAHRSALVGVINTFHRDHGLVPLVVCCRTQELEQISSKLALEEAVELRPPSDEQIDLYLSHIENTGTPLADVRATFKGDRSLYELLRSPLMLHVIALAYHGESAPSLTISMSLEDRQARLWDAYVDRMFEQRPIREASGYSESEAREWTRWLARMLKHRDQTEFNLDRLTAPWLPEPWPGRARLITGMAVGILTGLAGWLAFGLTFNLGIGIVVGMLIGVVLGLDAGFSGTAWWPRDFWPTEQIHLSWPRLVAGLSIGLLGGTAGGIVVYHFHGIYGWIGFALAGGLGGAMIGGVTSTLINERATPNEGVRRSGRHALRFGLATGFAAGVIGAMTGILGIGILTGIGIGFAGAMVGGLAIGLFTHTHTGIASFIHHYAVRLSLVRLKRAPWSYSSFLEAMAERMLLRQSGSAYLFVHRLLRDHLADSSDPATT